MPIEIQIFGNFEDYSYHGVLQLVSMCIWAPEIAILHASSVNRSRLLNPQPNVCSFLG